MEQLETGTAGEAYELMVERGKVREFAMATGCTDPSYYQDEHPIVPPTFLATSAFWEGSRSSVLRNAALPWGRLLSGGSEYVFHGDPLRAGAALTARQEVDRVYTKAGRRAGVMTFIEFTTTFADPAGNVVAEEHHLTIQTSSAPATSAPSPATAHSEPRPPEPTHGSTGRPTRMYPGGLRSGDILPLYAAEPVTRTGIVRYQGASGDLNPIHHDDDFALNAGYSGAFSVGMYHAGVLGSYVADLFGPGSVRRFGARFREQVWPGDTLAYGGRVVGREVTAGAEALELALRVTLPDGRTHIESTATVVV